MTNDERIARDHLLWAERALDEGDGPLANTYALLGHAYALLALRERLGLAQVTMNLDPGVGAPRPGS
jgi:hypothetical protein